MSVLCNGLGGSDVAWYWIACRHPILSDNNHFLLLFPFFFWPFLFLFSVPSCFVQLELTCHSSGYYPIRIRILLSAKNYYNEKLKEYSEDIIKVILLGNKTDLKDKRVIQPEEGAKFAEENNYIFISTIKSFNYFFYDTIIY